MKKTVFIILSLLMIFSPSLFSQMNEPSKKIQIQFDFNRKKSYSTNQFAVWIEKPNGELVKTLFVTEFTTGKGWLKKTITIPNWRKAVKGEEKVTIDAVSSATPSAGKIDLFWDLKDSSNMAVTKGIYKLFIEANLKKEKCVLFYCEISIDEEISFGSISERLSDPNDRTQDLITNVEVTTAL